MNTENRAVFFDRDGTLNVDANYLHRIEDFRWLGDAVDAIKYVNEKGILAIVATNQSGVARGFFPESDVKKIHDYMNEELKKYGAHIDGFYYCPHHPNAEIAAYRKDCDCRKPKAGLLYRAAKDFGIDLSRSVMIGDMERDALCGENAGAKGVVYDGGSLLELVKKFV